jgi:hypothetical protein
MQVSSIRRLVDSFVLLKWRWIAERTIGWLNLARRLSKDYEVLPDSSETFIRLTMISIMLARLAQQTRLTVPASAAERTARSASR